MNIDISSLSLEEKHRLLETLQQMEKHRRYNRINYFEPYPFQSKFYAAGSEYHVRFLMCGNRVGKTFSQAAEVACHATGVYPDWWNGHRFDKSNMKYSDGRSNPHDLIIWCVGITGDSTRKVLQKELFGTESAKELDKIGTGAIPKRYIDFDAIERDGHMIRTAKIQHYDRFGRKDGKTTIEFRSTQQGEHVLMGASIDYIWLDRFFFVLHAIG